MSQPLSPRTRTLPTSAKPYRYRTRGERELDEVVAARRVRVMQDWVSAALFRRDVAALTDGRSR